MEGLKAVFYARFHPKRGPSVLVEVPEGAVVKRRGGGLKKEEEGDGGEEVGMVDWEQVESFVIPPYELCGKGLGVCVAGGGGGRGERFRVMGWPISLESEGYERNRFTFNVCFVVSEHDGEGGGGGVRRVWEPVVRKTALFFQALELEDGILAAEEAKMEGSSADGATVLGALLRDVFTQLTTYGECCVRVSSAHTLNLRPPVRTPHPSPPPLKLLASHVPLLIRPLPPQHTWTPDLVLARLLPHLNGLNHLSRLAEKGGVELKSVKRAIRGLLALGAVKVMDLFHYQASYALTAEWGCFVRDEWGLVEECARYVCAPSPSGGEAVGREKLLALYAALATSQSVHDFVLAQHTALAASAIDVRRLVTFGSLKGFLRRVHKFALAVSSPSPPRISGGDGAGGSLDPTAGRFVGSGSGGRRSVGDAAAPREADKAWRRAALSSGWATPPAPAGLSSTEEAGGGDDSAAGFDDVQDGCKSSSSPTKKAAFAGGEEMDPEDAKLVRFLDGTHCLDEMCVALRLSEAKVVERLRSGRFGEVVVFSK